MLILSLRICKMAQDVYRSLKILHFQLFFYRGRTLSCKGGQGQ